jgi:hypothetical protein
MKCYVRTWGLPLARRIRVLAYESLPPEREVEAATWIFSDLDRLSAAETERARDLWMRLSEADPQPRLLNNPRRVLGRYELLSRLHDQGVNAFRAFRLGELPQRLRYPVFLREENEHSGTLSSLLLTSEELEEATAHALASGYREDQLLVVEFCDTSDEAGLFRKYAAFSVGGRIVPRHLIMTRGWMVNVNEDRVDTRKLAEERAFLIENPHEAVLKEYFRLANIDYGRIDYSLLDGEPQIWEINTNPMPVLLPWACKVRRLPNHWRFAREIRAALAEL